MTHRGFLAWRILITGKKWAKNSLLPPAINKLRIIATILQYDVF